MRIVWPETTDPLEMPTCYEFPGTSPEEGASQDPSIVFCKWEERFGVCEIQAILHMLNHLSKGLPGPLRRLLLRRAGRFPKLHGHFAPYVGCLGFHAEEGEIIGMDECWRELENGQRERLW